VPLQVTGYESRKCGCLQYADLELVPMSIHDPRLEAMFGSERFLSLQTRRPISVWVEGPVPRTGGSDLGGCSYLREPTATFCG
jgi:hypothetical protein